MLAAIIDANNDHAPSYGIDRWSERAIAAFHEHFGPSAEVFFVFNGTAANCLALSSVMRSGESVLCSDVAHIENDESAAPEFFTGGKLRPIPSDNGRLSVERLKASLIRRGDVHFAQATVLSLTQPTELGTVYSLEELREITSWARAQGLRVHVDGSRLGVAAAALGVGFRELTADLGVDVVSFGGTKNGLMGAEAVIAFDPLIAARLRVLRKQTGQLPSKSRFLAAQFLAYFENDLWRQLGLHGVRLARRLVDGLVGIPGVEVARPVEANAVFVRVPRALAKKLRDRYFFYVWDEKTWECRWMLSWDLRDSDIDDFLRLIRENA